ncbi:MAG: right-handed parallel beta-helix repeat-containing protein [Chloroflexota bacterium]
MVDLKLNVARVVCCVLFIWSIGVFGAVAQDTVLYVGLSGSDTVGDGSAERPFRTVEVAADQAEPGTTIYLLEGTYEEQTVITGQGTADLPITIEPAPNAAVRFDGSQLTIPENQNLVLIRDSAHLIFQGFEISNSTGRGLGVFESEHITLRDNRVHDTIGRGIGGGGNHITIENNEVWNASLENENEAFGATGGWKAGISTYKRADDSASTNFIIRNNHIHDVWGEGIIALFVDGALIEGNEVHDTYSVNIYVDNGRNIDIVGNYLHTTTTRYNRLDRPFPANGIQLANESYSEAPPTQVENILIGNNLIVGAGRAIRFWHDDRNLDPFNSYQNVQIVHNVVKNSHEIAIHFDGVGLTGVTPENVLVQNNIIFAGGQGQALNIAHPDAWTFLHNNWPNGVPELAEGPNSFAAQPLFAGSTGSLAPEDFVLQAESTSLGAGLPFSTLTTDYWGNVRHPERPSLGIYEPKELAIEATAVPPTAEPDTTIAEEPTPTQTPASVSSTATLVVSQPVSTATAVPPTAPPSTADNNAITVVVLFALAGIFLIGILLWVIYRHSR